MQNQIELNYDGSLLDQYPAWRDVVTASVYSCGRPFKQIAADLDMSVSELSRKLNHNPGDNVEFPLPRFDELLIATGDIRPVYWLIEKFVQDGSVRKKQAMNELMRMLPHIHGLLKSASVP
jgi:hypothetical protein